MITRTRILDERCLEIYETDIVNGGEVLIRCQSGHCPAAQ